MKPILILSLLLTALPSVFAKPLFDKTHNTGRIDREFEYLGVMIKAQVDAGSNIYQLPHNFQHNVRHPNLDPNYELFWAPVYKTVLYRGQWITVQWNAVKSCFGYDQHERDGWRYFVEVLSQDCFDGSRSTVATVHGKPRYVFYNTLLDSFGYYPYSPLLIPFRVVTPPPEPHRHRK
jgi:hypothetical protein